VPFDAERATRIERFFETVLRHPKERYSPFLLLPWQREFVRNVCGNVDEEGLRIVRVVYLEVPKKNGKSELAAGIALYMLVADGEPAAEVYGAATTKDQAGIVFKTAAGMVEASPVLRRKLRVIRSTKTIVRRDDPDSFYRAISADGDAQDGINPHCVIIDELHRWKTARAFELLDVLRRGQVARKQPLALEITTAGSTEEESPLCWREHEYTRAVEDGSFHDRSFYGKIYAADVLDDWTKPETWAKANPSLETHGGFLKLEALKAECDKAINQPSRQPSFRRYHLNTWLARDHQWMPPEVWDACAKETRPLIERPCYLGLDLSSTIDLTSLVAVFPSTEDDSYDVLPFFWMAKERVRERELADRVPYSTWIAEGALEATEGDVIDYRLVKKKIAWCTEMFSVQEFAYDPSHANQLAIEVDDELGLKCVPVPQRYTHMSEPTKKLMELALQHRIRHGGHPVLKWNSRCLRVKGDDLDNIRPVKPDRNKEGKRIDGMVALIIALSRAVFYGGGSVYETRGIATL